MPASPARNHENGKQRRAKKFRYPAPLPAPRFSSRLYVRLAPADVAMFRFLLEAEDNLAFMSTVDRWASVLRVTFSPHQEDEVRRHLAAMRETIAFEEVLTPPALTVAAFSSDTGL